MISATAARFGEASAAGTLSDTMFPVQVTRLTKEKDLINKKMERVQQQKDAETQQLKAKLEASAGATRAEVNERDRKINQLVEELGNREARAPARISVAVAPRTCTSHLCHEPPGCGLSASPLLPQDMCCQPSGLHLLRQESCFCRMSVGQTWCAHQHLPHMRR
jgi:hypothetical protein